MPRSMLLGSHPIPRSEVKSCHEKIPYFFKHLLDWAKYLHYGVVVQAEPWAAAKSWTWACTFPFGISSLPGLTLFADKVVCAEARTGKIQRGGGNPNESLESAHRSHIIAGLHICFRKTGFLDYDCVVFRHLIRDRRRQGKMESHRCALRFDGCNNVFRFRLSRGPTSRWDPWVLVGRGQDGNFRFYDGWIS
jgi:hypothetical protein